MADRGPCALHLKGSYEQVALLRRLQRSQNHTAAMAVDRVEVMDARDGYVFVRVTVRPLDPFQDPRQSLLEALRGLREAAHPKEPVGVPAAREDPPAAE